MVLAVPEIFAVGRRGGQQAGKRALGRLARLDDPIGRSADLGIGGREPRPIARDLKILPKNPEGLAVGVELVLLALEAAVAAAGDRPRRPCVPRPQSDLLNSMSW